LYPDGAGSIYPAAVMQVPERVGPEFSDYSHGFRPDGRLIRRWPRPQQYIAEGPRPWCVDLDLEKFFDRVQSR